MFGASPSQISRIIPVLIAICLFALPACAKYSGGSGTAQDPYQIATAADLILLGETPADYDKHFILTADIDLDPNLPGRKVFDRAVVAAASYVQGQRGTYLEGTPFVGAFDGDGHTISRLTIKGKDCLGLFGQLGSGAEVKNLGVVGVRITGSGGPIGGLVGSSGGTVTQCYSTGVVSGSSSVGGLVGGNGGTVTQCYSTSMVSGEDRVGGLVGSNGGTVTQCYSTGMVSGEDRVGGLVGDNASNVTECYSTGTVSGKSYVGGLVGLNRVTEYGRLSGGVTNSYSTAAVSGNDYVGGLVGASSGRIVTRCYSTGPVSGGDSVGGLVGSNWSDLTHCYSTGTVEGETNVGGLVGKSEYGTVASSFWDTQTSGQTTSAGGTGKTTAEMQTAKTFSAWGACGPSWTIDEGRDYPHLAWENRTGEVVTGPDYGGGTGTTDDPYLIFTAEHLNSIGLTPCHWDRHYKLMTDIDLSAFDGKDGRPAFQVIGTQVTPFTGIFDGDGHAISHLTITGKDYYLGLFGQLASGAEVRDLGVVGVNISGSHYVGGLAGRNDGTLIRCYIAGEINGTHFVGGLAGHNNGTMAECTSTGTAGGTGDWVGGLAGRNTGTITQCCNSGVVSSTGNNGYVGGLVGYNISGVVTGSYNTGRVTGNQFAGGLAGYNNGGAVTRCYNTGTISANNFVGGTIGYNDRGSVTQCYGSGLVSGTSYVGGLVGSNYHGSIAASFWDIQTSGQAKSAGGTGKTTAEMQTAKTFLDTGWDFVGETANGTEDIWWIDEGKDYPRLWWEAAKK